MYIGSRSPLYVSGAKEIKNNFVKKRVMDTEGESNHFFNILLQACLVLVWIFINWKKGKNVARGPVVDILFVLIHTNEPASRKTAASR